MAIRALPGIVPRAEMAFHTILVVGMVECVIQPVIYVVTALALADVVIHRHFRRMTIQTIIVSRMIVNHRRPGIHAVANVAREGKVIRRSGRCVTIHAIGIP
jgi:hypothetical protein